MVHDKEHSTKEDVGGKSIFGWLGRLVLTAVILAITSFFTPGFSINGLWSFILAAIVISVIDYLVESFMGVDASPFGKGIKGFVIAAVIIYLAQFLVPEYECVYNRCIISSFSYWNIRCSNAW